jgi:hypothetical protein
MACTTSDATLLFSYRPLAVHQSKVRLFDAGNHPRSPAGCQLSASPRLRLPSHTADGAPWDAAMIPVQRICTEHTTRPPSV